MHIKILSRIPILKAQSRVWDNIWQLKPFKIDEKCFLFHIKSSFRSQDTYIFVLIFRLSRKTAW